jgi:CheY-like chemotaxis protein
LLKARRSRAQHLLFLAGEGYSVVSVASGEEALKMLESENFDAVITIINTGMG